MEGDRIEGPSRKRARRGQPVPEKWEGSELKPADQLPEGPEPRGPSQPESLAAGRREVMKRVQQARGESGGSEEGGSEEAGDAGRIPPTDNSEDLAALQKYFDKLGSDWWPQKSKNGQKMWLRNPDGSGKTTAVTFEQKLWDLWVENLTEKGKEAFVKSGGTVKKGAKKEGEKKEDKTKLEGFVESSAAEAKPVVRNLLSKMSWYQNTVYNVGHMTFIKLLQAKELFPPDVWEVDLSRDPAHMDTVETGIEFAKTYAKALDYLLAGRENADKIKELEEQLDVAATRTVLLRRKVAELTLNVGYWQKHAALANALMSREQLQEFNIRMTYLVEGDAIAKAAETLNAKAAATSPEGAQVE